MHAALKQKCQLNLTYNVGVTFILLHFEILPQ